MGSLNDDVLLAFQRDIAEMMEQHFDERVAIIRDPETDEETLHKISGEDISESEYYALSFFEEGWNAALRSFERMGDTYLINEIGRRYSDEGEEDDVAGTGD